MHSAEAPYARRACSERPCEAPGCAAPAAHRAPRSREALDSYRWFCREHARAYNAGWNFCAGLSEREVEAWIRRSMVWERPSWRFGTVAGGARLDDADDPFGLFGARRAAGGPHAEARRPAGGPEAQALAELGLEAPVALPELKARYKELAMRHHPDRNGGCRRAEERLKRINQAYATLYKGLSS